MPLFRRFSKFAVPTVSGTQAPESLIRLRDADSLRVPGLPLVTIVSVVKDADATLGRAIESLRAQTYPSIEHVIIDGGSTDGTKAIIESHQDWVAAWSSEPDSGLYDAMNKGIALAKGDVIGILNADDWFEPDFLEHSINTLARGSGDFVFGNIWMHGYRGQDLYLPGDPDYTRVVRRDVPRTWHATMLCRRHMFERVGLYRTDLRVASDYDFQIRAYNAGLLGAYSPEAVAHVAAGGVSTSAQHLALREGFRCSVGNGYPVWKAAPHWGLRFVTTDFPVVERLIHATKSRFARARHGASRGAKRVWDLAGPLKPYIPGKRAAMRVLGVEPMVPAHAPPARVPETAVGEDRPEELGPERRTMTDQVRLSAFIEARHEGSGLSDLAIEALIEASSDWEWYCVRGSHPVVPALGALLCTLGVERVEDSSLPAGMGVLIDVSHHPGDAVDPGHDTVTIQRSPPIGAVRLTDDGLCLLRGLSSCAPC